LFEPPLPPPGAEWRTVRLEQLNDFLSSPCRFLLGKRLGIALGDREQELADDEPFLPDARSRRAIGDRLLGAALGGAGEDALLALARAGNEFPAGPLGDAVLRSEVATLWRFARALREENASALVPHSAELRFQIEGEEWVLCGTLEKLRASGLARHRYDDVRSIDYLAGWVDHLFLCASAPAGAECRTRWHSRDGIYVLEPYPEAKDRLAELVALYREGLQRPLHFFPASSWKYVTGNGNLGDAKNRWFSYWRPALGESVYPPYRLALRGVQDPLDDNFIRLANQILVPLYRHVSDPRL
jgi:exodeoxyribonuclease V gamma subunit